MEGEILKQLSNEINVKRTLIPYSSIQIYCNFSQYLVAFLSFLKAKETNREFYIDAITNLFKNNNKSLIITMSVRSAFSIFFKIMNFPLGSEILMTSINIPDMSQIVREYGLHPVPLDLSPDTTAPLFEEIKQVTNEKTRAIVLSYVYGVRFPIDDIIKFCHERNIIIIEDIAESFKGFNYSGHQEADLCLFSFGTIKKVTAFGGCLAFVREENLFQKMNELNESYEISSSSVYFKKLLKLIFPTLLLNSKFFNLATRYISNSVNFDYKEFVVSRMRGFPKQRDFLTKFHKRPCVQLLSFMYYRFRTYNEKEENYYTLRLRKVADKLLEGEVQYPGYAIKDREFWLFPIFTPDAKLTNAILNKRGVDAYLGATQLKKMFPPIGYNYKIPKNVFEFFDELLYLPLNNKGTDAQFERIVKETIEVIEIVKKMKKLSNMKSKL